MKTQEKRLELEKNCTNTIDQKI